MAPSWLDERVNKLVAGFGWSIPAPHWKWTVNSMGTAPYWDGPDAFYGFDPPYPVGLFGSTASYNVSLKIGSYSGHYSQAGCIKVRRDGVWEWLHSSYPDAYLKFAYARVMPQTATATLLWNVP